jgi:hypothetical protein
MHSVAVWPASARARSSSAWAWCSSAGFQQHHAAGRCELHAAAGTAEQRHAQIGLQQAHGHAHGRLRPAQAACGLRHRAAFGHGNKLVQAFKCPFHTSILLIESNFYKSIN